MKLQTKKPLDREIPFPIGYEYLEEYNIKAIRYGHTIYLEGSEYVTSIINEILDKINKEESVVICITGPPGSGKTYFGIRYGQILDKNFHINDIPPPHPTEDDGQLVFSREHLAYLTGPETPLKRGQVIIIDESHFGVGARSWQNRDQQDIVNYLAAIRSKGFVLILIVLHTRMIDALLRDFVVNYEFYMENRGKAICYRRFFPQFSNEPFKRKLGILELPLPDEDLCDYKSCLNCKHLTKSEKTRCETIRAIYERRKEQFLIDKGQKEENERKIDRPSLDEIATELEKHYLEIPNYHQTVHRSLLPQFIKETLGYRITDREKSPLATKIEAKPYWKYRFPNIS